MDKPLPTELRRLPEAGRLRIVWSDGHQAEYDYDYLRGYCPCAGCQGHHSLSVEFKRAPVSVTPLAIEPVGNYAVAFQWSDAHATGIYRFDFLRQICPCDECNEARKARGAESDTEGET